VCARAHGIEIISSSLHTHTHTRERLDLDLDLEINININPQKSKVSRASRKNKQTNSWTKGGGVVGGLDARPARSGGTSKRR